MSGFDKKALELATMPVNKDRVLRLPVSEKSVKSSKRGRMSSARLAPTRVVLDHKDKTLRERVGKRIGLGKHSKADTHAVWYQRHFVINTTTKGSSITFVTSTGQDAAYYVPEKYYNNVAYNIRSEAETVLLKSHNYLLLARDQLLHHPDSPTAPSVRELLACQVPVNLRDLNRIRDYGDLITDHIATVAALNQAEAIRRKLNTGDTDFYENKSEYLDYLTLTVNPMAILLASPTLFSSKTNFFRGIDRLVNSIHKELESLCRQAPELFGLVDGFRPAEMHTAINNIMLGLHFQDTLSQRIITAGLNYTGVSHLDKKKISELIQATTIRRCKDKDFGNEEVLRLASGDDLFVLDPIATLNSSLSQGQLENFEIDARTSNTSAHHTLMRQVSPYNASTHARASWSSADSGRSTSDSGVDMMSVSSSLSSINEESDEDLSLFSYPTDSEEPLYVDFNIIDGVAPPLACEQEVLMEKKNSQAKVDEAKPRPTVGKKPPAPTLDL